MSGLKKNVASNKIFTFGSLYQWALASSVIITLPLVFALIFTIIEVTHFTEQSQKTLFQAVNTTESSRMILNRFISLERSIRQFQVLNEPELFSAYQDHRTRFLDILMSLKIQGQKTSLVKKLEDLQYAENQLYQTIIFKYRNPPLLQTDLTAFDSLSSQARAILSEGEKRVAIEALALSEISKRVQEKLIYSALASIPLALVFSFIFVHLLLRPIKKISEAIRNLGEVGFEQTISIKGPQDLVELGQHLEWLRQRLNQLEHEKQQFIMNISHELKTPMATLKEGTDLLADNVVGELNTEQQEIIQLMELGNITLYDLVDNLLEYQKTIYTKVDLNLSTFTLDSLIKRIIEDYQLPIKSKNISLNSQLDSFYIRADYAKLKIIISNILSNALKFSPQNSSIGLTLSEYNHVIKLNIEDQGPGIPKEIQPLIFNDFYQGSTPQDWTIKGSGLGLSLVKHYLDVHNGSISLLKPNRQYPGARFSLSLPNNMDS